MMSLIVFFFEKKKKLERALINSYSAKKKNTGICHEKKKNQLEV